MANSTMAASTPAATTATAGPATAGTPATTTAANGELSKGVPYYEKLRRDLRETLQKKRVLDKNLVSFRRHPTTSTTATTMSQYITRQWILSLHVASRSPGHDSSSISCDSLSSHLHSPLPRPFRSQPREIISPRLTCNPPFAEE